MKAWIDNIKPALQRIDRRQALMAAAAVAVAAAATGAALYLARDTGPVKKMRAWWSADKKAVVAKASEATAQGMQRKPRILYYRNPMGLPDTSPVPKKDSMGMDYVPVYADEEQSAPGGIDISPGKMQKLGVRTEAAAVRVVARTVRATGRVEIDERQVYVVAPRFEGWIERLRVGTTGQFVEAGETLLDAWSPELNVAQREYLSSLQMGTAARGRPSQDDGNQLAQASLARLRSFGVPDHEVERLKKTRKPMRNFGVQSPVSGYVLEKKAANGMRFSPGDTLYQIADLSSVWVMVDVFEQDIAAIQAGQKANLKFNAYPGKDFSARVAYVYPTVSTQTHTAAVRLELPNPQGLLRPGMVADVELLAADRANAAVSVPVSAVIDSGISQTVLVERGDGRFEPRVVKLGTRNEQYVEVLQGVSNGERIVVGGNFLLDSESNLRAAAAGFGKRDARTATAATAANTAGTPDAGKGAVVGKHHARGTVQSVDLGYGKLTIAHEPVESLGWPAMTMPFKAGAKLIQDIVPGMTIEFDFIERYPGEYMLTAVAPAGAPASAPRGATAAMRAMPMRAMPMPAQPEARADMPVPSADWSGRTAALGPLRGGR